MSPTQWHSCPDTTPPLPFAMLARALRACALVTSILRPQNWLSGSSILMQLSFPLVPRKLLSSVPLLLPFPAPGIPSRSHYKPCLWKHQGSASPTSLLHTLSLPQAPSGGLSHPSGHQVMYFPRVSLSFLSLWCPKRVPPANSILQAYSVWHSQCCTACETFDNIGKLAFDELAIFPLWHPPAGAQWPLRPLDLQVCIPQLTSVPVPLTSVVLQASESVTPNYSYFCELLKERRLALIFCVSHRPGPMWYE